MDGVVISMRTLAYRDSLIYIYRVDDVELSSAHPKKAFIMGALEKEIRLSFAQRIRGTLPEPYQPLISKAKELETPDFKYNLDGEHYVSR